MALADLVKDARLISTSPDADVRGLTADFVLRRVRRLVELNPADADPARRGDITAAATRALADLIARDLPKVQAAAEEMWRRVSADAAHLPIDPVTQRKRGTKRPPSTLKAARAQRRRLVRSIAYQAAAHDITLADPGGFDRLHRIVRPAAADRRAHGLRRRPRRGPGRGASPRSRATAAARGPMATSACSSTRASRRRCSPARAGRIRRVDAVRRCRNGDIPPGDIHLHAAVRANPSIAASWRRKDDELDFVAGAGVNAVDRRPEAVPAILGLPGAEPHDVRPHHPRAASRSARLRDDQARPRHRVAGCRGRGERRALAADSRPVRQSGAVPGRTRRVAVLRARQRAPGRPAGRRSPHRLQPPGVREDDCRRLEAGERGGRPDLSRAADAGPRVCGAQPGCDVEGDDPVLPRRARGAPRGRRGARPHRTLRAEHARSSTSRSSSGRAMRVDIVRDDAGEAVLAADRQIVSVSGRTVRYSGASVSAPGASPAAARPRNALRRSARKRSTATRSASCAECRRRHRSTRGATSEPTGSSSGGRQEQEEAIRKDTARAAFVKAHHLVEYTREQESGKATTIGWFPLWLPATKGGSPLRRNGRIVSTDPVEVRLAQRRRLDLVLRSPIPPSAIWCR